MDDTKEIVEIKTLYHTSRRERDSDIATAPSFLIVFAFLLTMIYSYIESQKVEEYCLL